MSFGKFPPSHPAEDTCGWFRLPYRSLFKQGLGNSCAEALWTASEAYYLGIMPGLTHSYFGETVRRGEFGGVRYTVSGYSGGQKLPTHEHEWATLCFVLQGGFAEDCAGRTFECSAGDLIYRPADHAHADQFLADRTATFSLDLSADVAEFGPFGSAMVTSPKSARLMRRLYREATAPDAFSQLEIAGLLGSIQGEVALVSDDGSPRAPVWLRRVHSQLLDDHAGIPSLQELAHSANVHPMHLARAFRGYYKVSVGKFLRRVRIERCCQLMGTTTLELGEIALAAGFCDQAHFTRAFRAAKGATPGEYRRLSRV